MSALRKLRAIWQHEHEQKRYVVCNMCYGLVAEGSWDYHQKYHRRQGHRW